MTLNSTIIRIFRGMTLRIREMVRFENDNTNVRESPMTIAVFIWTVTAKAEQMPSICLEMGFS